jgi:hypothetical protein
LGSDDTIYLVGDDGGYVQAGIMGPASTTFPLTNDAGIGWKGAIGAVPQLQLNGVFSRLKAGANTDLWEGDWGSIPDGDVAFISGNAFPASPTYNSQIV